MNEAAQVTADQIQTVTAVRPQGDYDVSMIHPEWRAASPHPQGGWEVTQLGALDGTIEAAKQRIADANNNNSPATVNEFGIDKCVAAEIFVWNNSSDPVVTRFEAATD